MALGGRASMLVALGAIVVILVIGALYGTVAGLAGRVVDALMMRALDGLFAIPRLPFAIVILGEAFLSVLGLGLNPPTAIWGNIAQEGEDRGDLSLVVLASAAIAIFAVCASLLADGLQDALDPRRDIRRPPGRLRRLLPAPSLPAGSLRPCSPVDARSRSCSPSQPPRRSSPSFRA